MRVPLSWLRDYVDVDLEPEALAERLTLLGMEVKGIERWGADWRNVVVGELLTVEKHPRADRLSLTTRPRLGRRRRAARDRLRRDEHRRRASASRSRCPGAVLPGDRRIERTEKMGVVSNGMLCSGDELNLTGDADGILILPPDAPIGMPLVDLYGDVVLDVDVKPNRGDALSLVGLAREVGGDHRRAAPLARDRSGRGRPRRGRLRRASTSATDAVPAVRRPLGGRRDGRSVAGSGPDAAPGRRPAPDQQRRRRQQLRDARARQADPHLRRRRGRARRDGRHRLIVRRAEPGERLETIDHVARPLDADTLLIADERGPLGIAGIMGGAASEVSDATTRVIVE